LRYNPPKGVIQMQESIKLNDEILALGAWPEGGRRPTVGPADSGRPARFWARHKVEAVLRLLRGEPLEALSRELQVGGAQLSKWREAFLAAGAKELSNRSSQDDAEVVRLNAKIGELTMANELLTRRLTTWSKDDLWPGGGRKDEPDRFALHRKNLWPGSCL